MRIIVNGKFVTVAEKVTIYEYLESKGIKLQNIIVEHNFELPDREKWNSITLKENDNLEIIKFMGVG